ncbi:MULTISPECIES: response regulator [Sphingosinicellaceae]|uniref:response regulator n=1 Tax=Sphingosinicellaceae TaxID=2820280 RepID=UPI001C1E4FDD|nr:MULTISPECIES: response regulator [Polymorphobacter]QYE36261.1 response regulator [Polymorphobacter sp. PAMC 29334]UAJ10166.1 response regulator [Polymorphobacter megasporae]
MASSLTLLLVDDEILITEMVHDALEDAGFAVISANDGDRAMAVLNDETHAICGIITDINMGDTADGWSVARRARELNPDLPVVYMTGGVAHEWAVHGVPRSILVSKPFATAQIITAIASLLNSPAPPAAGV